MRYDSPADGVDVLSENRLSLYLDITDKLLVAMD